VLYYVRQTDALGSGVMDVTLVVDNFVAAPTVGVMEATTNTLVPVDTGVAPQVSRSDLVVTDPNGEVTLAQFLDVQTNTWMPVSQFHATAGLNTLQVRQIDSTGNVSLPTSVSFNLVGTDSNGAIGTATAWAIPQVNFIDTGASASDHVLSTWDAQTQQAVNIDTAGAAAMSVTPQFPGASVEWAVLDPADPTHSTLLTLDPNNPTGWFTASSDPTGTLRMITFTDALTGNPQTPMDQPITILVRESFIDGAGVTQYSPKASLTFTFESSLVSPDALVMSGVTGQLGSAIGASVLTPTGYDISGMTPSMATSSSTGLTTLSFLVESSSPLWDRGTTFNGLTASINDGSLRATSLDGHQLGFTGAEYLTEYTFTDTAANINTAIANGLVPSLTLNVSTLGGSATNAALVENFVHLDPNSGMPVYDSWHVLPNTP
jgi:hypothetical protein